MLSVSRAQYYPVTGSNHRITNPFVSLKKYLKFLYVVKPACFAQVVGWDKTRLT